MAGLLVGEQVAAHLRHNELPPSTFNPGLALVDPKDPIRITKLEIIPVHSLRTIFVKMHTNVGIIGIGEGTVEGRIKTVIAAIQELEQYLIGKDPRQVAHHWQAIYRHAFYRGGIVLTSALSAVDIAMWDTLLVGIIQRPTDLLDDRQCLIRRDMPHLAQPHIQTPAGC